MMGKALAYNEEASGQIRGGLISAAEEDECWMNYDHSYDTNEIQL